MESALERLEKRAEKRRRLIETLNSMVCCGDCNLFLVAAVKNARFEVAFGVNQA